MDILENAQNIDKLYKSVINAIQFNNFDDFRDRIRKVNEIENKFENNYHRKKKEGVFYTQKEISDFIFPEALVCLINNEIYPLKITKIYDIFSLNSDNQNKIKQILLNVKTCDPACGSGVFLLSAAVILHDLIKKFDYRVNSVDLKLNLIKNLYGFEINDTAIKLSKLKLLGWFCNKNHANLKGLISVLDSNLKLKNSLLEEKPSKFDIIIGNPPYGNILKTYQKELLKKAKIFYQDVYCAFISTAINWTKRIIAYLVPKSFLLRQGYIKFREDLLSKTNLLKIYDIGPNLFKNATNEVQIVILEKKTNHLKDLMVYEYPNKEITRYKEQQFDSLRICTNERCELNNIIKKVFVYTFEKQCQYCGHNTSLMNRIRIKANQEVLDLIYKIELCGDLNYLNVKEFPMMIRGEEAKSLKKIRKLLKKDLTGSSIFINAKEDFDYFYYKTNKSFKLENVSASIMKGNQYEYYIKPKLLIKHNNIYPQAIYTEDTVCFTSSIYSLLYADTNELKYLCAILNSILMQFYCIYAINNQKDTTINLNQYMIRHLPIIHCDENFKLKLVSRVDAVSKLLSQTNGNLKEESKGLLKKINNSIFDLYSISDEEKNLISSLIENQIDFFKKIY